MAGAKRLRTCRRCPGHPLQVECCHTKEGQAFLAALTIKETVTNGAPSDVESPVGPPVPVDPLLLAQAEAGNGEDGDSDSETEDKKKKKRVRVSASNPIYGRVEGCVRGSVPCELLRTSKLRTFMPDSSLATRRYNRELAAIIVRAERLSREVGCWFLINAQYRYSGQTAVTYASPRLRQDAPDDTADLGRRFNRLTNGLVLARQKDAQDLVKQLQELESQKEEALTRASAAEAALAREREENCLMGALVSAVGK
ncbi:hypothetical protein BDN72DRAFT_903487 [Pluteus cervinus]|uniref:Uncharacterized protein n=1 Tax=Pluteus cervinus TaxID=181527 RepID=A0ACD3A972_9AGAR|nr:hypothetical protein BDN72DRAFT_903487 [Pluteus cervinus]